MNNVFCSNCNYQLIIKKITNTVVLTISEPQELIKLNYDDNNDYNIYFDKDVLINYLKDMKKISKEDKQKKIDLYDKIKKKKRSTIKYILKCLTCASEYPLEAGTTIYTINFKKQNYIFDDDNIDLKIYDPTLPRTKDYKCENINCDTNKKENINKEAVFYRSTNTFHLKYACCICKHSWFI